MVGMSKAKAENRQLPKRFYKLATVVPAEGGFRFHLDGRELKTQARRPLFVASQPLADAIAAEWNAQKDFINPDLMPLTRLINLTLDRTLENRASLVSLMVEYAQTDLLCYRAPELAVRQSALFDPVLAWAKGEGMEFNITEGFIAIQQPDATLARVRRLASEASDAELTALAMMTPLLGSAILALAVWKESVTVEQALEMARIDETAQAEKWGEDRESTVLWEHKKNDIRASAFFLTHK